MTLMKMLTKNYLDSISKVTLTGGLPNLAYPLSNLLKDSRAYSFRALEGHAELTINFGEVKPINMLVLLGDSRGNLGFSSAKAYFTPTDFFTSDFINLEINTNFNMSINSFNTILAKKIKIVLDCPSTVVLSKILVGEAEEYEKIGAEVGLSKEFESFSESIYGQSGIRFSDINSKSQVLSFALHALDSQEKADMEDILDNLDIYNPFFIMLDPDNNSCGDGKYRYSLYCHQKELPVYTSISSRFWDIEMVIQEEK